MPRRSALFSAECFGCNVAQFGQYPGDQREQKPREDPDHDNDVHRAPRRLLNMLLIKNVAADMELDERAKPPSHADHGAAPMVKMNDSRGWEIVGLVSSIRNSFTVVGVDVIG